MNFFFRCSSRVLLLISLAALLQAADAPAWDSGGNGLLSGTWNFRQVLYYPADAAGDLLNAASLQGQITFDGNGHYSVSGAAEFDLLSGRSTSYSTNGSYAMSSGGFGYFDSPLEGGDRIYALVSPKGLIGSTTETGNGYTDLFVATPSSAVSTLTGSYAIACFSPSAGVPWTSSFMVQITTDGMGNLTQSAVSGFTGNGGSGFTGALTGATYAIANGAGALNLPDASIFAQSKERFWLSPDGTFLFGGAANGIDLFVGVRTDPAPAAALTGLYLEGGIDVDATNLAAGIAPIGAWYGSLNAANAPILHHRRMNTPIPAVSGQNSAVGQTFAEAASLSGQSSISADGGARVSLPPWPHLGIQIAMALPAPSGAGVFLSPQGIVNAASAAPFTAGISPGEWLTLYGSNLAPAAASDSTIPVPQNISGVQVLVNGVAAPVAFVSAGQISALVPQSTAPGIATVQVISNGAASNTITTLVNLTAPGVYTSSGSYAVAIHGDYSLVSPSSPAQPGETVAVYVDGLGAVSSPPPDGAAAASAPLSGALAVFAVDLDGVPSPGIEYAGLSPGLAATYQINFQVPPGTPAGDHVLGISGPDSRTALALISVGAGSP